MPSELQITTVVLGGVEASCLDSTTNIVTGKDKFSPVLLISEFK